MQSLVIWGGIIGSIFGVVTAAIGIITLYRSSILKGYAAERDFNHLRRNFESLSQNIDFMIKITDSEIAKLAKEIDTRCDRIDLSQNEIKSLLLSTLNLKYKPLE